MAENTWECPFNIHLDDLYHIDTWKQLINDCPVLASHTVKPHFISGCWTFRIILKWQIISVMLVYIHCSEESILEFRKWTEKKYFSDSCNLRCLLNLKVAKSEKSPPGRSYNGERKVNSDHSLEHILKPIAPQLESFTKSSSTHTWWRFSQERACLPLSPWSLYPGTTELTVV